jgi:hypothetical protein
MFGENARWQPQYRDWKYLVLHYTCHVLYAKQVVHGYHVASRISTSRIPILG